MNSNNNKIKQTNVDIQNQNYIENVQMFMYVQSFLTFTVDFLFL